LSITIIRKVFSKEIKMRLSIEISRDLERKLSTGFDLEDKIQKALMRATLEIQNRAKEIAPYVTGTLRRSITSNFGRIKQGITTVGSGVPYARIRHYINKKNPHTLRYLERGYTENEQKIRDIFIQELTR